jgi:cation diffusion facilitator family transporter
LFSLQQFILPGCKRIQFSKSIVRLMRSRLFIYVPLAADFGIAVTKFIAATVTGSSAMISEGIHSVIDTVNQLLVLWGLEKSKNKPDEEQLFGYGKEQYFSSFVVSLLLFSIGGCISFYEGITRLKKPDKVIDPGWNYTVLGISFFFTAITVMVTLKKFNKQRGHPGFFESIRQSKDPSVFIVLPGYLGDLIGLLIAFLGVFLGHLLHNPYYDGIASMVIGIFLIGVSILLARESRSLVLGKSVSKKTMREIIALAETDPSIITVKRHFSMYMLPEEVVLQLIAVFKKDLTSQQITEAINRIIKNMQEKFPRIKQIFIEPG